jgi:3-oxoacyl-[acyl-carrier protein] reductase
MSLGRRRTMGKLDGSVAIVTGAARGLGRAYAKRLAGLGAKVAVADLNLHSYEEFDAEAKDMTADSTIAEIEATGGIALGTEVDVRDHEAVEAMVARFVQEWGRVDVWSRMREAVVVGPWTPRPAHLIRRSYSLSWR